MAQTIQQAKNTSAMARVIFRSALAPRKNGWSMWKPLGVGCPQPMTPSPGMSPTQLENRMKMKTVAKNQKVFRTNAGPMMLSRNSCRLSTIHSQKFCAPSGTSFIRRVANCAKIMRPTATTHVTTMELVIVNGPSGVLIRAISTAC